MTTLFISDLHLDEENPKIINLFFDFLDQLDNRIDALYILGDFFEVWVGDDEQTDLQKNVCKKLKSLTEKNIPVYFMHGNRDFLIGKRFLRAAHCKLLKDPTVIDLYGKKILLMHGDTLCTDDVAYQKFRKKARNPFYQKLFLLLPLALRKNIASKMRTKSKKYTANTDSRIMDTNPAEVARIVQQHPINLLIHGHTHRPAIHELGSDKKRIVLAAWHEQGNVLIYRKNHEFELKNFTEFSL